ncbi:MAG: aconitate hydratase AcnA, partial [Calditrichia bacterium]
VMLELDMSEIEPSLAGPKRPQDRIPLKEMKPVFYDSLQKVFSKSAPPDEEKNQSRMQYEGGSASPKHQDFVNVAIGKENFEITHGSVVIAAITSCTNTSNPSVMIAAGLLAQKALEKGIKTKPWVKTSLAPGSRVVTDYLKSAGLTEALDAQKFNLVGYGCTTCIGNSGPLPEAIANGIKEGDLVAAAVLSGNRNFEGRIHPSVRANYLASPPLVVAYALAGRIDIDFEKEPVGLDKEGKSVFLKDIWPSQDEIAKTIEHSLDVGMFKEKYGKVYDGDENWRSLDVAETQLYHWDAKSTYIKNPPFFVDMPAEKAKPGNIKGARVLGLFGDSVTTDHISPAGAIPYHSPAGKYLTDHGVEVKDFNSFGSRRGNHEVMMRGTFGNIRIRNQLLENVEGGYTIYFPSGKQMFIYDAAMKYQQDNTPLIVIAGKEYGTGSSRDWAAKGTTLLGVKAVLAESYERIHRSNLIGMGVLPLQFEKRDSWKKLGLSGREIYTISGIEEGLTPGKEISISAVDDNNTETTFNVIVRLDTPIEVEYYENGGILQTVLRQMRRES